MRRSARRPDDDRGRGLEVGAGVVRQPAPVVGRPVVQAVALVGHAADYGEGVAIVGEDVRAAVAVGDDDRSLDASVGGRFQGVAAGVAGRGQVRPAGGVAAYVTGLDALEAAVFDAGVGIVRGGAGGQFFGNVGVAQRLSGRK